MHTLTYAYSHSHSHMHTYSHSYSHTHTCTRTHTYSHVCALTYAYSHILTHTHTHVHSLTFSHTHPHTHTGQAGGPWSGVTALAEASHNGHHKRVVGGSGPEPALSFLGLCVALVGVVRVTGGALTPGKGSSPSRTSHGHPFIAAPNCPPFPRSQLPAPPWDPK